MKRCVLEDVRRSCACALLAVTAAGAGWAQAPAERQPSQKASAVRNYNIPAGNLAQALSRFAAEAGVILAFDAALVQPHTSGGLHGTYSVESGFAALLQGQPLQLQHDANGYTLRRAAVKPVISPVSEAKNEDLPTVEVRDYAIGTVNALNREMIQALPKLNGDITSQLKINPNIQFSEKQLSSQTGGEIAPAEISIHGAKPYQNEFVVDGISITNDIDPGSVVSREDMEFVPGASQALAVDADLMCDVRVLDSNVSAEYGRFTGGVVQAELCKARKTFGGKVSVGYSGSNWTHLIIDPAKQNAFNNSSTADDEPEFRKWTYTASVETRPSPEWGLVVSTVRRTSDIPLKQFTASGEKTTQTRLNETLALKADWTPQDSRDSADFTLMYAPNEGTYFKQNAKNSAYTLEGGGTALSARLVRALDSQTITQQLSYTETTQSRRSDANYYTPWRWSTAKNWGDPSAETNPVTTTSIEGGFGNLDQTLSALNYKIKTQANEWDWGSTKHTLVAGLDLKEQHASYERLSDLTQYTGNPTQVTANWTGTLTQTACSQDSYGCSTSPTLTSGSKGQYFRARSIYKAGSLDLDAESYGAFVEDSMRWGAWTWRLGARVDYESLMNNTNIAPRSSVEWDVQDNLHLTAGANRYYGRSLMAYALQEKVRTLKYTQTRNLNSIGWNAATQNKPANRLQDIDSPYDDELHLAALWDLHEWGQWNLGLTERQGKNQIVKRLYTKQTGCDANQCFVYTNEGGSTTSDLTLSWNSNQPWKVAGTETTAWVAFNKSNVRSNYSTYAEAYSAEDDEIIQYDGKFINYSDMPADNYNRPWTLRLAAITKVPAHKLTVSNVLRIRDGYQQILKQTGVTAMYNGTEVDVWKRTKLPLAMTLDTVFQWTPFTYKQQQLDIKLSIENILDRPNMTTTNSTYATYERGRTFLLEVAYQF